MPDVAGERDIDKAGSGDVEFVEIRVATQPFDDQRCQIPRFLLGALGQNHGRVRGQVAVAGIPRLLNVGPADIDVVQLYDGFASWIVLQWELMGFC